MYDLNPANSAEQAYLQIWKPDWERRYGASGGENRGSSGDDRGSRDNSSSDINSDGGGRVPYGQKKVNIIRVMASAFGSVWLWATLLEATALILLQVGQLVIFGVLYYYPMFLRVV